jgi:HSP20 family protein
MFENTPAFQGNLFNEFRRLEREMDQLFGASSWPSSIRAAERGAYPPVNIGGNTEEVDVYIFAAGLDPRSLDISIQQNLLAISGERNLIREEGANYYRSERFDGPFRRILTLPEDVDSDQVDAVYRDGILRIIVKRQESVKPRRIEVK